MDGSGNRETERYKCLPYDPRLRQRARELRKAGVLSEVLLWQRLKCGQVNGWDFDRQKIIGSFIVDFFCGNIGLVVEIDGSSHDLKTDYDIRRDRYLKGLGLKVLHVLDRDVRYRIEDVILEIEKQGEMTTPSAFGSHPSEGGTTTPPLPRHPSEGGE